MNVDGLLHQDVGHDPSHDHLAHGGSLPWSRDIGGMPSSDGQAAGVIAKRAWMTAEVPAGIPSPRRCNRHVDCDEADRDTLLGHGLEADHCHEEYCEDCYGY